MRKKLFVILFGTLLLIPGLFTIIASSANRSMDVSLGGYHEQLERPAFQFDSYLDGSYQTALEQWWNNSFQTRGILVRSYNQLRLKLFQLGNRIVGKNQTLYEEDYIMEYLMIGDENNFSLPENQKTADHYIAELLELNQKLKKLGKQLVVYTTPNKCDFTEDFLPEKYKRLAQQNPEEQMRAIDYLRKELKKTELVYIDGYEVLTESMTEYPVFYTTGIHLSRTAEQKLHASILNSIQDVVKTPIKTFRFTDVKESGSAFWRDADLWELMNVWDTPKEMYYEYKTKRVIPEQYQNKGYLIQGGSFADGLRRDLAENAVSRQIHYIFYNSYWMDQNGHYQELAAANHAYLPESDWSALDMQKILNEIDVVLIELNEKHIRYFSNGFIEYLNKQIEEYVNSNESISGIYHWLPSNDYASDLKNLYGVYAYEEGYTWIKDYSSIQLQNEQITNKGLELELEIPEYWSFDYSHENESILIYVNGIRCKQLFISKSGIQNIQILPDELPQTENHFYEVELYAPQFFIPSELKINGDNRELSLILRYLGEVR